MIKYLISFILVIILLNGCSDRDYGEQDISKIPATMSTEKVYILSSVPSKYVAQSSYINIEFSSYMDFDTFTSSEIIFKNLATDSQVEIELDGIDNHLYIRPLASLIPDQEYLLSIDSKATDIMGNSIDKAYEKTFICKENFWEKVEVGETHSMALSKDGDVYVWGSNDYKQLQIQDDIKRVVPLGILDTNNSKEFNAGLYTSGIIDADGLLSIFGKQSLDDESLFLAISIGNNHSATIKDDHTLWSWGRDNHGQLGDAGIMEKFQLVQENTVSTNWSSVSAGDDFTIALKSDGSMWGWGDNEYGEIGNSQHKEKRAPVQEDTNATDWKEVSAGVNHSVAIKEDGTLWSWGDNLSGELGDGTNTPSRVQVQESSSSKWISISAGNKHTVAIKDDGTLWVWGDNYYGQLGDNSVENRNNPTRIGTVDDNWTSVSCGKNFTIAVKEDGTMWSWGYNAHSQLGLGDDTEDKLIPTEIK